MRKLMKDMAARGQKAADQVRGRAFQGYMKSVELKVKVTDILAGQSGEGFVDTAVKILISVVIGALLLAGLYTLFDQTVIPTLTSRIKSLFDYKG